MLFHRYSYKNSCFRELVYQPVSLCQSNNLQLQIQKKYCYLKNAFCPFFVLKLCPIQVVISLSLRIKLTMDQLLLIFLCNFSSFFSYVKGILVTNHFSLLLIDGYIVGIHEIITHSEQWRQIHFLICSDLLNCIRRLGTMVITAEGG